MSRRAPYCLERPWLPSDSGKWFKIMVANWTKTVWHFKEELRMTLTFTTKIIPCGSNPWMSACTTLHLTCLCTDASQSWPCWSPEDRGALHARLGLAFACSSEPSSCHPHWSWLPQTISPLFFLTVAHGLLLLSPTPALSFIPTIEQLLCSHESKSYIAWTLTL